MSVYHESDSPPPPQKYIIHDPNFQASIRSRVCMLSSKIESLCIAVSVMVAWMTIRTKTPSLL